MKCAFVDEWTICRFSNARCNDKSFQPVSSPITCVKLPLMMQAVHLITYHEGTDVEEVNVYVYPCFHLSAGSRWVFNAMPRPLYPRERASEPVWTGAEILALTGVRTPIHQPIASHYTEYTIPETSTTHLHKELEEKLDTEKNEIELNLQIKLRAFLCSRTECVKCLFSKTTI